MNKNKHNQNVNEKSNDAKNGIVSKDKYFEFIKSNENYSDKQKEFFIWYFENIGNNYVTRKSNKQIQAFVKFIYFGGDIDKISKGDILFQKFVKNNFREMIKKIKFGNLTTDDEILTYIHKTNNPDNSALNKIFDQIINNRIANRKINETKEKMGTNVSNLNGGKFKSNDMQIKKPERNDWKYMIDSIVFKIKQIKKIKNENMQNFVYLDIGCGNGKKTKIFGNYLKIDNANLHGCDISTWGPYEATKNFGFNFTLIKDGKLNYPDSTFDIITTILTLHHVEELDNFINEIVRVLKSGGLLILVEHNIYDDIEAMLIDIQHLFYEVFMDNNVDLTKNDIYTKCYNQMEWDYIFSRHKMKNIHNDMLYPQLENRLRYDNLYYGIFEKK